MAEKEEELLACYRQLAPEEQAAVLSHVRTARIAENSVRKTLTAVMLAAGDTGNGERRKVAKAVIP
jgi:hypothetical protein